MLTLPGAAGRGDIPAEYGPFLARFRRSVEDALVYPLAARRQGLAGRVELDVLLEPGGRVTGVEVHASSSHAVLDEAGIAAVRSLPLIPLPEGSRGGRCAFACRSSSSFANMATLLIALALDLALGDPPSRWHPVAWVGRALDAGRRRLGGSSPGWLRVGGAVLVAALAGERRGPRAGARAAPRALAPGRAAGRRRVAQGRPVRSRAVRRGLGRARCARGWRLDAAREALGRDLVSRPVDSLDAGHVASGAIESLAENLTDSLVAPVLFFLLGGVPAAWAYRVVNTADAMLGYRQGELEHLGKVAARLDDALNWVPARLAALGLVAGAALAGASGSQAWRFLRRDGGTTASPNAGHTMAAMAGGLGVRLVKPGLYTLGDGPLPDPPTIGLALRVARRGGRAGHGCRRAGAGRTRGRF